MRCSIASRLSWRPVRAGNSGSVGWPARSVSQECRAATVVVVSGARLGTRSIDEHHRQREHHGGIMNANASMFMLIYSDAFMLVANAAQQSWRIVVHGSAWRATICTSRCGTSTAYPATQSGPPDHQDPRRRLPRLGLRQAERLRLVPAELLLLARRMELARVHSGLIVLRCTAKPQSSGDRRLEPRRPSDPRSARPVSPIFQSRSRRSVADTGCHHQPGSLLRP